MNDTIVRIKRDCTELNSLGRATISITSSPRLYLCDCTVIKDAHAPLNIHRYTRLQDDRKICNSCYQSDKFRFPSFFFLLQSCFEYISIVDLILILFQPFVIIIASLLYVAKRKKCLENGRESCVQINI